ncbi:MAG TPA: DUF4926 domain-containing protein [Pyrinomonadaceae bacterium]|jgi:hypothetical protein|nr:DUF4926 domain-containing protein [Pyrinomonadaceae bacterium]
MIKEHERVVLTKSVPAGGLEEGDVGTVVHVYKDDEAYEVEFLTLDGRHRRGGNSRIVSSAPGQCA